MNNPIKRLFLRITKSEKVNKQADCCDRSINEQDCRDACCPAKAEPVDESQGALYLSNVSMKIPWIAIR